MSRLRGAWWSREVILFAKPPGVQKYNFEARGRKPAVKGGHEKGRFCVQVGGKVKSGHEKGRFCVRVGVKVKSGHEKGRFCVRVGVKVKGGHENGGFRVRLELLVEQAAAAAEAGGAGPLLLCLHGEAAVDGDEGLGPGVAALYDVQGRGAATE